jgi:hypothetical protein
LETRLPAHLEVGALIRQVQGAGGFATVLAKGERDAGTILVVMVENGAQPRAYERMPQRDGTRQWTVCFQQDIDNKPTIDEYVARRSSQDPDLWVLELDIVHGERFIGLAHPSA